MANPSDFIPLPNLPLHVLLALAEGERHGWGIIKRIEEITAGDQSPSSGSLYLAMSRMEVQGLISDAPAPADETDSRRRYYRLTAVGRAVLAREVERLGGLVRHAHDVGIAG